MKVPTPPSFVANFDSATAMSLALARFLHGQDFPALGQPPAMKPLAKQVNRLPRRLREKVFVFGGATETVSPRRVDRLDMSEWGEWLSQAYPDGRYPAVAVGSSNGALNHLYAALRIPWLPQTYLVPVRQRVHPDDPVSALERGVEPGRALLDANPDLQLHHMHDANQDRLMVRALTYFRVKRRQLGPDFEAFLEERLEPGGTILLVDCRARWRTTRIGDRHVFQHGAIGGATQEEFHEGSERVADYLERYDSPVRRWESPQTDTESPEAEWGFEEALAEDVLRFARERGHRVVRLAFDEPEDPSPFVADLYRGWYRARRLPANRLLVSSFIVHDPHWTLRTGSVPFWVVFNMRPSLEALEAYLDSAERYDDIHLMLFQHGVEAVGLPSIEEWREVLVRHAQVTGRFIGLDPEEFPLDFSSYARYDEALKEIPARHALPPPLPLAEVERFLAEHADRYDVEWREELPPA